MSGFGSFKDEDEAEEFAATHGVVAMLDRMGLTGLANQVAGLPRPADVQVACPQCGEPVEVGDVTALILALHQMNECTVSPLLVHHDGGTE